MTNEIEAHKAKLDAAYAAGYSGDRAVVYASCIPGEDVETATVNAKRLASVAAALSDKQQPAEDNSPDDDEDADTADAVARSEFADAMGPHL